MKPRKFLKVLWLPAGVIALGLSVACQVADAGDAQGGLTLNASDEQNFDNWAAALTAQTASPATAEIGDYRKDWKAPDGRVIHLVVKVPHPTPTAATVVLATVPDGADARPYFENALDQVRAEKAGRLVIPKGTYQFKSLDSTGSGHWLIHNVSDLTIEGTGSTLVFAQNAPGLYVTNSQRVKIAGLHLDYSLHTNSLATMQKQNGHNVLVIDPRYPVSASDQVYYASEFDPANKVWIQGGQRVILPPGSANPAVYAGNQTYTSSAFDTVGTGKQYVVFHHWYGGNAVKLQDAPGPNQDEDIILSGLTIYSSPGMGIVAYGVKRGVAVVNSTLTPNPNTASLVSSEYDGLHSLIVGGDELILNNHISHQGDDGINLSSAVQQIVSVGSDNKTLVLSTYSRFIQPSDQLVFFDSNQRYLGKATVAQTPKALGGLNYQVVIDRPISGLDSTAVVRDLSLVNSRVAVLGNTIDSCNCHGLLVQVPNVLVQGNVFSKTRANGIRLLANVGSFKEGFGAFNVLVTRNILSDIGWDDSLPLPWAAISAYGGTRGNGVATAPVNKDLLISNNIVTQAQQGCVTVASSRDVQVTSNVCKDTDFKSTGSSSSNPNSLSVLKSARVTLSGNHRTGATTGGINIDTATVNSVTTQSGY